MSLSLQLIHAARLLLLRAYSRVYPISPTLTRPELAVMLTLHVHPGCTAVDVASWLGRDKTTLSRSISKLSQKGFIRSELDSIDGRRKNLFLTDEALVILQPALGSLRDDIESATANLSTADVERLRSILGNLVLLEQ